MGAALSFQNVVSPYDELLAFEYLYSKEGMTRKKLVELFENSTILPSEAVSKTDGLFGPNMDMFSDVQNYIDSKSMDFSVLVKGTPQFPAKLDDADNTLPVFYYKGNLALIEMPTVSVVGTRNPSEEGRERARTVAKRLAENNYVVVSGLADGIDTEAMRSCLASGGETIGVIGTPIDEYYPKKNAELQDIVAKQGLLISQVPMYRYAKQHFKTKRYYFPERNITMAALSDATIIVEAGETSGTRTQAKACIDQGRKLILFKSTLEKNSWARSYVEKGAYVVSNFKDILEVLKD